MLKIPAKLRAENKDVFPWLKKNIKPYCGRIALLIAINSVASVVSVVSAYVMKELMDAAQSGNKERLIRASVFTVAVLVFQLMMRLLYSLVDGRLRINMEVNFKNDFISRVLARDYVKISSFHSGDVMTRLTNDVGCVMDGLISILPRTIGLILRIVSAFVALFLLDKRLAVIFSVIGISVFIVTRLSRRFLTEMYTRIQRSESNVRSFSQEIIENLLVVNVFDAGRFVSKKADELLKENADNRWYRTRFYSCAGAALNLFLRSAYMLVCVICAFKLFSGGITYGTITAILQLVNQLQSPFKGLSGVLPAYYNMLASAERILEVIGTDEPQKSEPCNAKEFYDDLSSFEFDNISFAYDRDTVIENSSLTVEKGDFVTVSGISGIGKSTLLKMMLGVLEPSGGEVYFKTAKGKITPNGNYRALFSYVPQGNMLLSGTIYENITFMNPEKSAAEVARAVKLSCVEDFIGDLPYGLDTVIGERGKGLSEGQVQRIAIARAILRNAPIMLLDEATSALDSETEKKVLQNIRSISGVTCIIVSHKEAASTVCDKAVRIVNKKIITEVNEPNEN